MSAPGEPGAAALTEIAELVRESRIESLSQEGRPPRSPAGHRAIAEASRAGDAPAAAAATSARSDLVSDVPLVADGDRHPGRAPQ
ncbi:hypothetical protein ACI79G_13025 [Geodermatophilus sp. SYSU D00779]